MAGFFGGRLNNDFMAELTVSTLRMTDQDICLAEQIQAAHGFTHRAQAIRKAVSDWAPNQRKIKDLQRKVDELEKQNAEYRRGLRTLDQSLQWVSTAAVGIETKARFEDEEE